ncbi:hypothetical protein QTN47_21520 [Danxiaibacter flavus]|uniref:Uncharacterized protein n=1 Tax=Danxiaibacter flavus TaxID=3049108 RepID=A0ABV3ZJY7_9BACT|nr:hypothetical protein QNM32_21525 [Chitinophagaceae bacterium DXS]
MVGVFHKHDGFLKQVHECNGIELEQEAINDTANLLSGTGWKPGLHAANGYAVTNASLPPKDNLFTYLRVVRHAPGAVRWEKKWTRNVPSDYAAAGEYLKQHTGYSFPILKPVKEKRVIRTLTVTLRDNLDKEATVTRLKMKMYAGHIFSALVRNEILSAEIRSLSAYWTPELNDEKFTLLDKIAQMEIPADIAACKTAIQSLQQQLSLTEKEAATLLLAVAASHSPAQINDAVIELTLAHMEPAAVIEIIVWLSVLQLLHRLSCYYSLMKAY